MEQNMTNRSRGAIPGSRKERDPLCRSRRTADLLSRLLCERVKDLERDYRRDGKDLPEKTIREAAEAAKAVAVLIRGVYDIPTATEESDMRVAEGKLELDRQVKGGHREADRCWTVVFEGEARRAEEEEP